MKRIAMSVLILIGMISSVFIPATLNATPVSAASCDSSVLGVTPWYRGLTDDKCNIRKVGNGGIAPGTFITMILLNVIQAALTVSAYVAVGFIIKGGFDYMISAGASDGMAKAKKTIMNSVIGLLIVVFSAVIVNTIANIL